MGLGDALTKVTEGLLSLLALRGLGAFWDPSIEGETSTSGSEWLFFSEMGLVDEVPKVPKGLLSLLSVRGVGPLGSQSSQRDWKAVMPRSP